MDANEKYVPAPQRRKGLCQNCNRRCMLRQVMVKVDKHAADLPQYHLIWICKKCVAKKAVRNAIPIH